MNDAVQASCLIAQYCFFNRRVIEGNRHLLAAKRMAFDLGLCSISEPDVSSYGYGSGVQDTTEKSVVFWQVFMVDSFWSVTNHCEVALPDESPYRYSTTPLPVKDGVRLVSWKQKVISESNICLGRQRYEQSYLCVVWWAFSCWQFFALNSGFQSHSIVHLRSIAARSQYVLSLFLVLII